MSENKGKTICAYRRQRLAKVGVPISEMEKVCYPLEVRFQFELINTPVNITPIREMEQGGLIKQVVKTMVLHNAFGAGRCYWNALELARALGQVGLKVNCVDGYYYVRGGWHRHRFNEIDGVFFDATAEEFLSTPVQDITYKGVRLFSAQEMYVVSLAAGFLTNYPYQICTGSTLPFDEDYCSPADATEGFINEYYINDDGYMRRNAIQ